MSAITIATKTPPGALNCCRISIQIFRILNTNSLHLITISLLFILLIFFTYIFAVHFSHFLTFKTLTTILVVTVTVILSTVAGIALITYSTHQALHRIPLAFISAFKSLSHSFIPLLSTFIKLAFIFILITLSPLTVTEAVKSLNLGFHLDVSLFSTIANTIGVITVLYFITTLGYAAPISVLESKFGFTPLTESASQSFKFQFISRSIMIITGFIIVPSLAFYPTIYNIKPIVKWWLIMQTGIACLDFSLFVLVYIVANTMLYVHCKLDSGEDAVSKTVKEEEEFPKMFMFGGFTNMFWLRECELQTSI